VPATLVVTNDFPPRIGGIESFVADVCALLDDEVVVYASGPPGAAVTDAGRGYPVARSGPLLLPTRTVAARVIELVRRHRITRVVFGAAAPLGLLAPALRTAGVRRIVGLTHGHETWWAGLPGARSVLRRIGDGCDHLTVISAFTHARISPALSPWARARLLRLPPPIDIGLFRPETLRDPTERVRAVAVGRFVAQKGFDTLLHAWRRVLDHPPDHAATPELVLVGDGPQRPRLQRLIGRLGLVGAVQLTGAVPRTRVVAELQRADVFALPMRSRLAGLNPEGLGLAAIEAAACGLPVVVGRSGGAPETVLSGRTGFVVEPDDPMGLADRLTAMLADPAAGRVMGAAGRRFVAERFGIEQARRTVRTALDL
jgi:phosphatidylinositol alpha-1,6-mannosyltransferase